MLSSQQLREFCFEAQLWASADLSGLGSRLLLHLSSAGAFRHCSQLECESVAKLSGLDLPKLEQLVLNNCRFDRTGFLHLNFSVLRKLHVETCNLAFAQTASIWTSDSCPALEELCWSVNKTMVSKRHRKQAYTNFLKSLGKSLGPEFAQRRPRFRVSVYNGQAPPPSLTVWCSLCKSKLVCNEAIFAIGPGTQPHIDCEAFVWGSSLGDLVREGRGAWNCPSRCHNAWDLFLVAGKGSGICMCGFNYGLACGPRLAHFAPGRPELNQDGQWFEEFLDDPRSIRAVPRAVRELDLWISLLASRNS